MLLALRLGRTLEELQNSMSSQEFSLWMQMYSEDQWGDGPANDRADERAGLVAATIANFAGKTLKKDAKQMKPSDFFAKTAAPQEAPKEVDPVAFFTAVSKNAKFDKKGVRNASSSH
jgi:hypothetical protein